MGTVWITGGARGIGAATVRAFAARGARVAFSYKSADDAAAHLAEDLIVDVHQAQTAILHLSVGFIIVQDQLHLQKTYRTQSISAHCTAPAHQSYATLTTTLLHKGH